MIAAVVVHHRRWDSVPGVVRSLVAEGIAPADVVVVDNSEEPSRVDGLRSSMPAGVALVVARNRGYAAAVNSGLAVLSGRAVLPSSVLVATHEVVVHPGAVSLLGAALDADPLAAAAGPTLLSPGSAGAIVWSRGGTFTRWLHMPAHVGHRGDPAPARGTVTTCRWLDGAFVLYRWADLHAMPLSEEFFLYMEETDLHLRLGRAGRRVLHVPAAVVEQESGGTPPYWFARNLSLLFARNLPWWRGATVPIVVARAVAVALLRRDPARVRMLVGGYVAGRRWVRAHWGHVRSIRGLRHHR